MVATSRKSVKSGKNWSKMVKMGFSYKWLKMDNNWSEIVQNQLENGRK
jgi:hypothetical protein